MGDWKAILNGVTVCGGSCENAVACLLLPPDGTGVPAVRTEDQTYDQRDGVEHFADWYEPRILTLTALVGSTTGCNCDGDARANARALMEAWSRSCDDDELVLFSGCETERPNLEQNPSFTVDVDGWASSTDWDLSRDTSVFRSAPASAMVTATAPDAAVLSLTIDSGVTIAVEEYHTYRFAAFVRSAATPRPFVVFVQWDDGVSPIGGFVVSGPATSTTSGWTEVTMTVTAPPTATRIVAWGIGYLGGVNADGEVHYFDDMSVVDVTGDETDGPFGVVGRARVASLNWRRGRKDIADALLRFDSVDHRLYVLDADGTPGSGAVCTTITGTPVEPDWFVETTNSNVDHHWPLDFPHLGTQVVSGNVIGLAVDAKGSEDQPIRAGYITGDAPPKQAPSISYALSMSSVEGPATLQIQEYPTSYTSGMVGWWQYTPSDAELPGAVFSSGAYYVGRDSAGTVLPEIAWNGTPVAMNSDVQDAFGFTSVLRDQPVFILMTWTASNLYIFAGHAGSGAVKLIQTVAVGSILPAGQAPFVFALGGRISNVISGANHYATSATGEALVDSMTPAGLATPTSELVLADMGQVCVPFTAEFSIEAGMSWTDLYIFREDGSYVGFPDSANPSQNPSSLDTAEGTATMLFGTNDATPRITGDPFLTVNPGERLNVFGGGDATICFRPAVISA